jgi:hypothetical protein
MTKTKAASAKTEKRVKLSSLAARDPREGEWVPASDPQLEGVELKVRPIHYGPFQQALQIATAKLARKYPGNKQVPPEETDRLNGELYAEHLLLDWRGFDEPYSPAVARESLTAPAMHVLRNEVRFAATVASRATVEFVEAAAGNSEPASGGN